MKTLKNILSFCFVAMLILGCEQEDNLDFVKDIKAPTNVSASVRVIPDNTGVTVITPLGDGVTSYTVDYGDGSEISEAIAPGEYTEHTYAEGTYQAIITAFSVNGLETAVTQNVVVSFVAPENVSINADIDASNPFILNVSAEADYAASFLVFFDTSNPDEEGTPLGLDETVSFEYPAVGDYTIRVVALSGGTETTEVTEVITIAKPTELPIDFEIFDTSVFIGFGGASAAVIDNPDTNGNSSSKVGQIIKDAPEVWAGNVITTSTPIDFSSKKIINMNVWSPRAGGKIILKVENLNDNQIFFEREVTTIGNSAWEEVSFDLSAIDTTQEYQKLVLFFDFGVVGSGGSDWTFYIDDIKQEAPDTPGNSNTVLPLNFESGFSLDQFDGGGTMVVANPDVNGNTSDNVLQLVKGAGQPWAGSKVTIPTPFNFSSNTTITAKVWSPRAGLNVLLKFEDDVPWPDVSSTAEITATTTLANQWETLTFDFAGIDTSIDWYNLVLIMDNGTAGDGSANYTIYIDDISSDPLLDFEPEYTLSSFDGGAIAVIANPDTNGNTSTMVAQMIKGSGQPWAGSKITVPTPFDFSSSTTITVSVWSPRAGLNVLLKFEDNVPWPDVTSTAEITATTTVANQWETLTYDFSGIDTSIDWYNLVLIMDNGTNGDGSANYTIYIDDIDQN